MLIAGGRRLVLSVLFQKFKSFKNSKTKMKLSIKLAIASACAFFFIIIAGFIVFPKMLKSKIKSMVNLAPGTDIRSMFLDVPFGLDFNIYMFNITNPMEIQKGGKPKVQEVGPFCYSEWKKKVNVEDVEADDTISYNSVDTFLNAKRPGCKTGQEIVTIPHPIILGIINAAARQKPGALSLINKAIKSIWSNPESIFLTAKANDILFEGVPINCGVKDFAGKALCSQFKEFPALKHLSEDVLAFALLSPKNGTEGKKIQALRGTRNFKDVGRIVKYDDKPVMDTWPEEHCNVIQGTDGTIFPPMLKKDEGLLAFASDLCRTLPAYWVEDRKYDGIPVRFYTADLGDSSKNEKEKCYCYTPDTCLKKGLMDLYKCIGIPTYASLPHFYNCDKSYLNGVEGLSPNKEKHEIIILFESITGGPVMAKKRLQFNMPLQPNEKVDLFKNFTDTVIPMFWVEEGVELNNTFTGPIKQFFTIKKVVKISKWLILLISVAGMGVSGYLHFYKESDVNIKPIQKVTKDIKEEKGISVVNPSGLQGQINHAMSTNEIEKF